MEILKRFIIVLHWLFFIPIPICIILAIFGGEIEVLLLAGFMIGILPCIVITLVRWILFKEWAVLPFSIDSKN